jgi:response regulator NasT
MLERHGMTVCAEARTGLEAVALARTSRPEIALLDVRMPELDGVEAARRIYAEQPIPIVMLTAFAARATVDNAIDAGVFAYLVKPFRETDVVSALRAAAARHRELLEARRAIGRHAQNADAIALSVPSAHGGEWPLTLRRRDDGSLDVRADGA